MSSQQRYTSVLGIRPTSGEPMRQTGQELYGNRRVASPSTSSVRADFTSFSPVPDQLAYFPSRQADAEHPELDSYYDGNVPPPHRLSSYSDSISHSRPVSTASVTAPFIPHRASDLSYKDLPPAPVGMYSDQRNLGETSESYWPVSDGAGYTAQPAKRSRKKALIIGGIVVGILAVLGIVLGVVLGRRNSNNNAASASSSGPSNSSGITMSDPNDPSSFIKDPKLHQSFWGFAYTPQGSQPPACGATQANVTRDIQMLSQLTTRLRLYGANCNDTALVLQAIRDTKVNITIWPAIYIDSNEQSNAAQLVAVQDSIETYGIDHIEGIIVGNEYILGSAGSASTTSSAYASSVSNILSRVSSVRTAIEGMKLPKTLPIGTSDAGSLLSTSLATGIDFFMANVHPYFGQLAIDDAAAWTQSFFQEFDVDVAATAPNNPQTYIAETGWPTQSLNASEANSGAGSPQGDASVANLQTFLDTYACQANTNGTHYFYFEAFDEPWKARYGGVEPFWGLFDSKRNLKNVTIPTCS